MGKARRVLDWGKQFRLAINPEKAKRIRSERMPEDSDVCTMCGDYCAMKIVDQYFAF
jgi:phosphomethylpyrimidine synthase